MTKIKFFKVSDKFVKVESSGHTGYADYGKDVLCATISGIVQSTYIGLSQVLGLHVKLIRHDKVGYISIELSGDISEDAYRDSQIIFGTLYKSIEDLVSGYSKYISMEVIE